MAAAIQLLSAALRYRRRSYSCYYRRGTASEEGLARREDGIHYGTDVSRRTYATMMACFIYGILLKILLSPRADIRVRAMRQLARDIYYEDTGAC